jgi:MoaA/NifB/PqqE/SkfB family radical SAM enzyme
MARLVFREEEGGALLYELDSWRLRWLEPPAAQEFLAQASHDVVVHRHPAVGYLSAPLKVFIGVTARCNLSCQHCVVVTRRNQVPDISLDDMEAIFCQLSKIGVLEVRMSGGEPTLRPDLPLLVSMAREQSLSVSINSNGMIPAQTCVSLARSGVDRVHISLDGMAANNDRIRGEGVFRTCTRTIARLREQGVYVRIVVCLDRQNIADIESMLRLAEDLTCDIKFSPIAAVGSAGTMGELLDAGRCQVLQERFRLIRSTQNVFFNFGTMVGAFASYCELQDFDSTVCGSGRTQLRIELSGDVYGAGCGDAEEGKDPLGHRTEDIETLWHKGQRQLQQRLRQRGGRCLDCDLGKVFRTWLAQPSPSFNFGRAPRLDGRN